MLFLLKIRYEKIFLFFLSISLSSAYCMQKYEAAFKNGEINTGTNIVVWLNQNKISGAETTKIKQAFNKWKAAEEAAARDEAEKQKVVAAVAVAAGASQAIIAVAQKAVKAVEKSDAAEAKKLKDELEEAKKDSGIDFSDGGGVDHGSKDLQVFYQLLVKEKNLLAPINDVIHTYFDSLVDGRKASQEESEMIDEIIAAYNTFYNDWSSEKDLKKAFVSDNLMVLKNIFSLFISLNNYYEKAKVKFLPLQMSFEALVQRLLGCVQDLHIQIKDPHITKEVLQQFSSIVAGIHDFIVIFLHSKTKDKDRLKSYFPFISLIKQVSGFVLLLEQSEKSKTLATVFAAAVSPAEKALTEKRLAASEEDKAVLDEMLEKEALFEEYLASLSPEERDKITSGLEDFKAKKTLADAGLVSGDGEPEVKAAVVDYIKVLEKFASISALTTTFENQLDDSDEKSPKEGKKKKEAGELSFNKLLGIATKAETLEGALFKEICDQLSSCGAGLRALGKKDSLEVYLQERIDTDVSPLFKPYAFTPEDQKNCKTFLLYLAAQQKQQYVSDTGIVQLDGRSAEIAVLSALIDPAGDFSGDKIPLLVKDFEGFSDVLVRQFASSEKINPDLFLKKPMKDKAVQDIVKIDERTIDKNLMMRLMKGKNLFDMESYPEETKILLSSIKASTILQAYFAPLFESLQKKDLMRICDEFGKFFILSAEVKKADEPFIVLDQFFTNEAGTIELLNFEEIVGKIKAAKKLKNYSNTVEVDPLFDSIEAFSHDPSGPNKESVLKSVASMLPKDNIDLLEKSLGAYKAEKERKSPFLEESKDFDPSKPQDLETLIVRMGASTLLDDKALVGAKAKELTEFRNALIALFAISKNKLKNFSNATSSIKKLFGHEFETVKSIVQPIEIYGEIVQSFDPASGFGAKSISEFNAYIDKIKSTKNEADFDMYQSNEFRTLLHAVQKDFSHIKDDDKIAGIRDGILKLTAMLVNIFPEAGLAVNDFNKDILGRMTEIPLPVVIPVVSAPSLSSSGVPAAPPPPGGVPMAPPPPPGGAPAAPPLPGGAPVAPMAPGAPSVPALPGSGALELSLEDMSKLKLELFDEIKDIDGAVYDVYKTHHKNYFDALAKCLKNNPGLKQTLIKTRQMISTLKSLELSFIMNVLNDFEKKKNNELDTIARSFIKRDALSLVELLQPNIEDQNKRDAILLLQVKMNACIAELVKGLNFGIDTMKNKKPWSRAEISLIVDSYRPECEAAMDSCIALFKGVGSSLDANGAAVDKCRAGFLALLDSIQKTMSAPAINPVNYCKEIEEINTGVGVRKSIEAPGAAAKLKVKSSGGAAPALPGVGGIPAFTLKKSAARGVPAPAVKLQDLLSAFITNVKDFVIAKQTDDEIVNFMSGVCGALPDHEDIKKAIGEKFVKKALNDAADGIDLSGVKEKLEDALKCNDRLIGATKATKILKYKAYYPIYELFGVDSTLYKAK